MESSTPHVVMCEPVQSLVCVIIRDLSVVPVCINCCKFPVKEEPYIDLVIRNVIYVS